MTNTMGLRTTRTLLVGLMMIGVAGCASAGGSPVPSNPIEAFSPAPTSVASAPTISPSPLPGVSATGVALAPGTAISVLVDNLQIRSEARTAASVAGTVSMGDVLVIDDLGAPTTGEGFTWYPVTQVQAGEPGRLPALPAQVVYVNSGDVTGWVAATDGVRDAVAPIAPRCPSIASLQNVQAMLPGERGACFGSQTLTLQGTYGCGGCGGTASGSYVPSWLASPLAGSFLSLDPHKGLGPLLVYFPPGGRAAPADGTIIRVRGHFNDPIADTCRISNLDDSGPAPTLVPVDQRVVKDYCADRFVVDSDVILGVDPSFGR